MDIKNIVTTERYPITKQGTEEYSSLLAKCRGEYLSAGLVTLPGFLRPSAVATAVQNVNQNIHQVFESDGTHNMFLDQGDPTLPSSHVRNQQLPTQVGALAYDFQDPQGAVVTLYRNESFREFLRSVLGLDNLYRLDCPIGACTVNVFKPGQKHAWHFDEACHSVTIMLQKAETGGHFRLTKIIRQRKEISSQVFKILEEVQQQEKEEESSLIRTLEFEPGTLSIFSGSTCLHEVGLVEGGLCREVAVLCYANEPNKNNSPEVQQHFFGRTKQ